MASALGMGFVKLNELICSEMSGFSDLKHCLLNKRSLKILMIVMLSHGGNSIKVEPALPNYSLLLLKCIWIQSVKILTI